MAGAELSAPPGSDNGTNHGMTSPLSGVSAMSLYVPSFRVDLMLVSDVCHWMQPMARNKKIHFYQDGSRKLASSMPKLLPGFPFFPLPTNNFSRTKETAAKSLPLIWKTIPHGRD
jgi:hypothetical protein